MSSSKGEIQIEQLSRSEQTIARRVAESRATVPDLELRAEVDMGACLAHAADGRASIAAMLMRACARALRAVPRANGAYRDGQLELYSRINVGVVVPTDDGYLVPTVFDADRKTLAELTVELDSLAGKARAGALTPPELSGATFTFADLGMYPIADYTPVISPPQAAAVAAGAVRALPVVRDEDIVPGHAMTLTLVCDHRILYGAHAAEFISQIKAALESPPEERR